MNIRGYSLGLRGTVLGLGFATALACSSGGDETSAVDEAVETTIVVTSSAFSEGAAIPTRYTCDGEDVSPPLSWSGVPESAKSLALISDDPDAGDWVHWVLYGVPGEVTELPEAMPTTDVTSVGARNGTNDFRRLGYGGPCPPRGSHRYLFKLYALDTDLDLGTGAKKKELLEGMEGHVVARGQLMGTYRRQ